MLIGALVAIGMGARVLPDASWVPIIGMILSGVMLLSGRILFLRFLHVLAVVVQDHTSNRRAQFSLFLILLNWAAGVVGWVIEVGGSALRMHGITPLSYLIWIGDGMVGLYGLILYDRLLSGLGRSVQAFADAHGVEEDDSEPTPDDTDDPSS